jgi:hypothetical protein
LGGFFWVFWWVFWVGFLMPTLLFSQFDENLVSQNKILLTWLEKERFQYKWKEFEYIT